MLGCWRTLNEFRCPTEDRRIKASLDNVQILNPTTGRILWLAAAGLWVFGIGLVLRAALIRPISDALAGVSAVAADIVNLAMIASLLHEGSVHGRRRQGWWAMFIVITVDLAATIEWARLEATTLHPYGTIGDWLYQLYYPSMTMACALFFLSCGGSFRKPQTWLDAVTVLVGVLTALWAILYASVFTGGSHFTIAFNTKLMYLTLISVTMTMTALLFTQIMDWRAQRAMMLIVCTALSGLVVDVVWLILDVNGAPGAAAITNVGAVVYSALLASAVVAERSGLDPVEPERIREGNTYSFLPGFVLLLSIALFVGSEASKRGLDVRILVGIILFGAVLLVARQQGVRDELRHLNRAVAIREAEARLTELVRQSPDLFAVVDSRRTLKFVSAAAAPMLGINAEKLRHGAASELLGVANEAGMAAFLDRLEAHPGSSAEIEVRIRTATGEPRVLRVIGSNQAANALIEGITLTVCDVSEQRALEREVLDVANRERLRLCSSIHEGLGQDLTGISLLLRTVRTGSAQDTVCLRQSLEEIDKYVKQAISTARDLAIGLSPLQVMRGSLSAALARLAADTSRRLSVRVEFIDTSVEQQINDMVAESLYRIAQEAIGNALRHSQCSLVEVALRVGETELTLDISDNGSGFDPVTERRKGLGLRMMEYRARIIGGSMQFGQRAAGGTRIVVSAPASNA